MPRSTGRAIPALAQVRDRRGKGQGTGGAGTRRGQVVVWRPVPSCPVHAGGPERAGRYRTAGLHLPPAAAPRHNLAAGRDLAVIPRITAR